MTRKTPVNGIWSLPLDRRQLLKGLGVAGSLMALGGPGRWADALAADSSVTGTSPGEIPRRALGKTGVQVSALCFGGAHWGRIQDDAEAIRLLHAAIDAGVNFFDNAWEYNGGRSEELMGKALQGKRQQVVLMTKVCSHGRDKKVALQQLDDSLRRLKTDFLDLWQIHDVRTEDDFATISRSGGALEAFISAKESGIVKNIGVTGHHDSAVLSKAVEQWPVDTVLMPVNPVEGVIGGFLTDTLPKAKAMGVAVIGMKVLGAGHFIAPGLGITAQLLVRYALSCGITLAIVGCSSPQEVQDLSHAADLPLLSDSEMEKITELFAPHARELAFYRGVR